MGVLIPPYDIIGKDSDKVFFQNENGVVINGLMNLPIYQSQFFIKEGVFATPIEVGKTAVCRGIDWSDEQFGTVDVILQELASVFDDSGLDWSQYYIDVPSGYTTPVAWPEEIRNFIIENREFIYDMTIRFVREAGIEIFVPYDSPEEMLEDGFLIKEITDNTKFVITGDNECYPHAYQGEFVNGEATLSGNEMAKFGYKFTGIRSEAGVVNVGEKFYQQEGGTFTATPVFEQLTGKAHGGVIMKF